MADNVGLPDPVPIYHFVAKQIVGASKGGVSATDLAGALGEIELETEITGASFIKAEVIDPEWHITNALVKVTPQGILEQVEVEFPEGSGWKWILCAVELTTDPTKPQIYTFENKSANDLREYAGPKLITPGSTTRAEFVRQLLIEAGIDNITIPGLRVLQRVKSTEEGELGTATVSTAIDQKANENETNKAQALSAGSKIAIKGQTPTTQQLDDLNTALSIAGQLGAGEVATVALIVAGIAESSFRRNAVEGEGKKDHYGIWQSSSIPGNEVNKQAEGFLKGGQGGFQGGGAIALGKTGKYTAQEVAAMVEAGPPASFYDPYMTEARAIVSTYGGVGSSASGTTGETPSDVGLLHRGSKENTGENSWECITRLAQEVKWYFFVNGAAEARIKPNGLPKREMKTFYMTGEELKNQKPALWIDIPKNIVHYADGSSRSGLLIIPTTADIDNTALFYHATHELKTRAVKKTGLAKPQTPQEVILSMICPITAYGAGDVFVFENSGPCDGRWVVSDAVRLCISEVFTTFTLEPPEAPNKEPEKTKTEEEELGELGLSASGTPSTSTTSVGTGKLGVVEAAKKALSEKSKYEYDEIRPMPSSLFGAAPRIMDCSGFSTLCYKAAGEPDPNDLKYDGAGYTGTLWAHGTETTKPEPGDLCFYGTAPVPEHVTVYIGGGQVISMGEQGDPSQGEAAKMGPAAILGYRTY
jgi:hypothetical protein